jgi:transposase
LQLLAAGLIHAAHVHQHQVHDRLVAEGPSFHLLPNRWVVERTFGWLMHCRRLVRDHEQTAASAAGWTYLAITRLMLRRLA